MSLGVTQLSVGLRPGSKMFSVEPLVIPNLTFLSQGISHGSKQRINKKFWKAHCS